MHDSRAFKGGIVITAVGTAFFIIIGHFISMEIGVAREFAMSSPFALFLFIGHGVAAAIAIIGIGVAILAIKG